jgi:DNA-directed RNA polymerase specialized sigma24 family protein
MKTRDILKSWPVDVVTDTPARRALEAGLVNAADLLRLKVIARWQQRGLPPEVSWSDLLQEAFTRVLEGSRRHPDGLPMVAFVAGVMRSLREQYWRRARRGARQARKLLAGLEIADSSEPELLDPEPSPERRAIALQEMAALNQLFADDETALQLIAGLYEGSTPEEICMAHGISKVDYDSTRRRIRRALVRAGLRSQQP